MIGRLTGVVLEKSPPNLAVIDVQGVGYEVETPMSTFCVLPAVGATTILYIQLIVRDDAHLLYGFASHAEREAFRLLIKVSGIGPKSGIVILSGLSVTDLYHVIQNEDIQHLTKVPGIGKKTAERMILELRDKIGALSQHSAHQSDAPLSLLTDATTPVSDAVLALTSLGYKANDAEKMVRLVATPELTVDELIRKALQHIMKK